MSIGLYIVLAPLYLKSVRKLQEKRFVFVKILAIIIPENGAKVSKIKCFQFAQQTPNKLQINAISYEQLTKILDTKDDMPLDDKKYLQEHFEQNLLSEQEINNFICDRMPNCKKLFNYWEKSNIKYLSLTSVGIVLGANRCKQISGDTFNLNIWI